MFAGFSTQYIAPETWLGKLTRTHEGRLLFVVIAACLVGAANFCWLLFKTGRRKDEQ